MAAEDRHRSGDRDAGLDRNGRRRTQGGSFSPKYHSNQQYSSAVQNEETKVLLAMERSNNNLLEHERNFYRTKREILTNENISLKSLLRRLCPKILCNEKTNDE